MYVYVHSVDMFICTFALQFLIVKCLYVDVVFILQLVWTGIQKQIFVYQLKCTSAWCSNCPVYFQVPAIPSSLPLDSSCLYCNTCGLKLATRNKLFKHLNDTGHALRVESQESMVSKTGKRKKKKWYTSPLLLVLIIFLFITMSSRMGYVL